MVTANRRSVFPPELRRLLAGSRLGFGSASPPIARWRAGAPGRGLTAGRVPPTGALATRAPQSSTLAPRRTDRRARRGSVYDERRDFNFRQLRARLESRGERFVSTGDTEVAHRWIDLEGPGGVEGLEGMFALAHWSEREGRLLLARDRLGVKPLYYARMPGGLALQSQPKALLPLQPISPPLDPATLSDYLAYGYVPFDRCIFAGIPKWGERVLQYEPDGGRVSLRRYWTLVRNEVRDDPEVLRERIGQAVSSHLVSDVPVGAFLSGGLDSTTVAAVASRELAGLSTFAVGYVDGDSSDILHARIASRSLGTRHREEILHMDGLAHALARCAEVYDEPVYDPRALAMLDLARMTRSAVKVVLSGDGGDEVFGGYGWHETMLRYQSRRETWKFLEGPLSLLWRGVVGPLAERPFASRLAGSARLLARRFTDRCFAVRGFFSGAEQRRVLGRAPEEAARLFRQFDRPDLPLVHRLLWLDLHTYLPDNGLALVDRSTMAVGLEARVPLLDRGLIEYAFSLPPSRLLRPGATKVAFRKAVEPWIPEAIRSRPKAGFSPPFKRWIGGPGREAALARLEGGLLASDGVIDASAFRALVEGGAQRRYNKLWLLLSLEAWYGRWIAGKSAVKEHTEDSREDRSTELLAG